MTIVILQLPDVKSTAEERPSRCPSCTGETFQRWGAVCGGSATRMLRKCGCIGIGVAGVDTPSGIIQTVSPRRNRVSGCASWRL